MNETNLTEQRLRSWQPRRPAARLKRRIFAGEAGEAPAPWLVGWLTPAMACAMFTLMVLKSGNELPDMGKPVIGAVLNDHSYAAYASKTEQSDQNHLEALTFDWTNSNISTSSNGFTHGR